MVICLAMIVLSQRERLNFKSDNAMVSLHSVVHDHRNIEMIVEHNLAESFELADWNVLPVVRLQFLIVFVSKDRS